MYAFNGAGALLRIRPDRIEKLAYLWSDSFSLGSAFSPTMSWVPAETDLNATNRLSLSGYRSGDSLFALEELRERKWADCLKGFCSCL